MALRARLRCEQTPQVRDSTLKLVALAVYAAVGAFVVILALVCTLADPADSNLRKKIKKVKDGSTWNDREDSEVRGSRLAVGAPSLPWGGDADGPSRTQTFRTRPPSTNSEEEERPRRSGWAFAPAERAS
jgi:hypothetical protein